MSGSLDRGSAVVAGAILDGLYRLDRLIGEGGMGTVYAAVQLRLNKQVAVKVMLRDLAANQEALSRFRREAEVTSQLGHPHIVQTLDFGTASTGEPYLVMEFLGGEDLEKRIQRIGRLPLPSAVKIVNQIASALAATHAKTVVHRDLKPANVFLLEGEGVVDFVKVLDFGISKARAAATKLTRGSVVMGTPNYMAPEQARGQIDQIDHRTDQWALGCIAYEMLAGRPPFVGEDIASLLYQVIHEAPPPILKFAPNIPGGVEKAVMRALSKKQSDRFPTVAAFAREMEAAVGVSASVEAVTRARTATMGAVFKNLSDAITQRVNALVGKLRTKAHASIAEIDKTLAADTAMFAGPVAGAIASKPMPTTFSQTAGEMAQPVAPLDRTSPRKWIAAGVGVLVLAIGMIAIFGRSSPQQAPQPEAASTLQPSMPAVQSLPAPGTPSTQPEAATAPAAPEPPPPTSVAAPPAKAAESMVVAPAGVPPPAPGVSSTPAAQPSMRTAPLRRRPVAESTDPLTTTPSLKREPSQPTSPPQPTRPKRRLITDL